MAKILRSLLVLWLMALPAGASAQKFYPDDPVWKMPKPVPVDELKSRDLDALYDFVWQSFRSGQRPPTLSEGINTLGEVADDEWFTNRHARRRMSREELQRGPGNANPPMAPFVVVGAKTEGITPGFTIEDAGKRRYFVKVDPLSNPEMATAADVIGSKFFYALGYNTPENYILNLRPDELSIEDDAVVEIVGRERRMTAKDITILLDSVPRRKDGSYRLLASLAVSGKPIGPFRYEGTRSDDPNDIVPHERRRDLRGLHVFAAWLNHTDAKGGNSLDVIVEESGVRFVRHYLIDFGAMLGSDSDMPKNARFGHEYILPEPGKALRAIAGLGFYSPAWERVKYPDTPAAGRFAAEAFDPSTWKSNYPNPAFLSRQPGDEYWAAKQVMAFTNEDIRALVETGQYSDASVVDYMVSVLAARRDTIGRTYLTRTLPLENFRIEDGLLQFDDLGSLHGVYAPRQYDFRWSVFDNATGSSTPLTNDPVPVTAAMASATEGAYLAIEIKAREDGPRPPITVYVRKTASRWQVAGVDR